MRSLLFRTGLLGGGAVLALLCACGQHHVGEYPEVQRDKLAEAQAAKATPAESATPTPTPVNFFPEKKTP